MRVARRYRSDTGTRLNGIQRGRLLAAFLISFLLAAAATAHASVSVLLEQPYGKLNLINPAGHSAVYLDHVCAETPLQLRPCRAGELGVVLSRYDGIGGYDWLAMPLIPYLYAVNSAADIPGSIDRAEEIRMREDYRLLGSAFDRTIYGFRVNTTAAQDAQLIAYLNDHKNLESYNGAFRNCADFSRTILNRFYPHAVRRNYIADLGLTSPKSVARSLSHYAGRHPETGFEVFMIPQVKGDLPRSHANNCLAEGILKRFGLPLVVVSPISTAVVLVAYVGQGRFPMPKDAQPLNLIELGANDVFDSIDRPFPAMAPALPPLPSMLARWMPPEDYRRSPRPILAIALR